MASFEVEYQPDEGIRFTQRIMSTQLADGRKVSVSQSIGNGGLLFLNVADQQFTLSLEHLALAWLGDVLKAASGDR